MGSLPPSRHTPPFWVRMNLRIHQDGCWCIYTEVRSCCVEKMMWLAYLPQDRLGKIFHDVNVGWQWTFSCLDILFIKVKAHGILGTHEHLGWRWGKLAQGVIGLKRGGSHQEASEGWGRMTWLCPGSQALLHLTYRVSRKLWWPVLCRPLLKQIKWGWPCDDLIAEKAFNIFQLALHEKTSQMRHRRGLS